MALGKDLKKIKKFFAECKAPALGKEFSKKNLCRVPLTWHSTKRSSQLTIDFFAECLCGTR
jgi:hypothetical protein